MSSHLGYCITEVVAAGSTYGTCFRVTDFGESHGRGVGCVIDGCPPGIPLSEVDVQVDLDRRRPGQSQITTPRIETETCEIYSGVSEGVTIGTPILVLVPNTEQRGHDGGRSLAREAIGRVISGAVAKKILKLYAGTEILAYVSNVQNVVLPDDVIDYEKLTIDQIESNIVRCPDPDYAEKMIAAIDAVRVRGDSVGGVVSCIVRCCPHGLGSPLVDTHKAKLAKALMSLPATKAFQFGNVKTRSDQSRGIQGGTSNWEIIKMAIGFKPTSTISRKQNSMTRYMKETVLIAHGCHDLCFVSRVVPMIEAMVALVLVDQLMPHYVQNVLFPINPDLQGTIMWPEFEP